MKNIVFVGFMGSGKTTIGKRTAAKLNIEFYDTDAYIQKCEKMPVYEILSKKGAKYLEGAERFAVSTLLQNEGCLISTGGDTPLDAFNMDVLQKNSIIIWLKASPETVYKNTRRSVTKRPGLALKTLDEITEMMKEREPYYAQSHITVCIDRLTVDEAATEIIKQIQNLL